MLPSFSNSAPSICFFPTPLDTQIKKVCAVSLLYDYIKGKTKRNWLSKEQIRTPKNMGGIGFFDITKFYSAQKCTLIRRYAKDQTDDVWRDVLDHTLGLSMDTRGYILEWGDLRLEKISRFAPPGLKSYFMAMAKYAKCS